MAEEKVFVNSGDLRIEGLLEDLSGDRGVVITHPHPLYGGEMHNPVVEALVQAFGEAGYTTLRFNFRGVGESEGEYDGGRGEQEDVKAALRLLEGLGKSHVFLAGYSFGAWVNFMGLDKYENVRGLVMISPPVGLLDFKGSLFGSKVKLVITGSNDDIAEPEGVRERVMNWNSEAVLRVIEGADHFYWGKAHAIKESIKEYLENE
ncbi:MAG: alpha/beta hydrolase [Deltaproteobacteria bacterium]|nr:alpha/beta hydrolase [Deltaproteobacteria bacterium]